MKKMTQKTALSVAVSVLNGLELTAEQLEALAILDEMANKVAKKSTKLTASQLEAVELREKLLSNLTDEFIDHARFAKATGIEISNQRFTAQMKVLVNEGKVEKGATDEKKVGYRLIQA